MALAKGMRKRHPRASIRKTLSESAWATSLSPCRMRHAVEGKNPCEGNGEIKCRLPQYSGVSVGFQSDAFFSGRRTEAERAQNVTSYCKTNHPPGGEIENPGALAGATGANIKADSFKNQEYRQRADNATALCHAIADCHPDDAVTILAAALEDLRPGRPVTAFRSIMLEAESWASFATRNELKCYAVAAFNAMRPSDQSAFLSLMQGRASA